jgi:hypothetical protein
MPPAWPSPPPAKPAQKPAAKPVKTLKRAVAEAAPKRAMAKAMPKQPAPGYTAFHTEAEFKAFTDWLAQVSRVAGVEVPPQYAPMMKLDGEGGGGGNGK